MTKKNGQFTYKDAVSLREHLELQILHVREITDKAQVDQKEYNVIHNNLLREIDRLKENFITRKEWEADKSAKISLLISVLAIIGVAVNLMMRLSGR